MIEIDINLEAPNILKEDIIVKEIAMINMLKMNIDIVITVVNIENAMTNMMMRIERSLEVEVRIIW
jgi:hypothetical protein